MSFGNHSTRRGFTLIEVLISLVILSIGIVLVLRAFDSSLLALRESKDATRANMLISGKIEELQESAFEGGYSALSPMEGGFTADGLSGETRMNPVQTSPDGSNVLSQITVRVWREGGISDYSATTYINARNAGKGRM